MSNTTATKQAAATVGILNTVRWIGVAALALFALVTLLVLTFSQDNHGLGFILGAVGAIGWLVIAALHYAIIGWFVDTLALLRQIADRS